MAFFKLPLVGSRNRRKNKRSVPRLGSTILIVDDEPSVRRLLERLLVRAGHRVLVVFEGADAAFRSLGAATEILLGLSELESVFEKREPPGGAVTAREHSTVSMVYVSRAAENPSRRGAAPTKMPPGKSLPFTPIVHGVELTRRICKICVICGDCSILIQWLEIAT